MAAYWKIQYSFIDEKGNTTRRTHYMESAGVDLSLESQAVLLAADALLTDYRAVSDAGVGMSLAVNDDAWGAEAPAAGSDVSDVAHVNVRLDDSPSGKVASLAIPAPIDAMFAGGAAGTEVDISNAALIAFVANFEDDFTLSDGENVDATITNGIRDGEWRSRKLNPR